jgi:indole-3-glycerol phosphate synthase
MVEAAAAIRGRQVRAVSGFLDSMAQSSAARVAAAAGGEPLAALWRRAEAAPAPPPLQLSGAGFDIIAEIKLRSPAAGQLGSQSDDWLGRAVAYARGGAAAVSVLTEPSRFDGSLRHLERAAESLRPLGVPTMRKDFLVDPYQVAEARAAGAGGVLLIVRMLTPQRLQELLDAAAHFGLFVLLEAFDGADLATCAQLLRGREGHQSQVLVGINSRDLQTLQVVPERFESLSPLLPPGLPAVAESGVASADDARQMRRLGFRLALIGTALMTCEEPQQLLRQIFAAARTVKT